MKTRKFRISFESGRHVTFTLQADNFVRLGNQLEFIGPNDELLFCIRFNFAIQNVEEIPVEEAESGQRREYTLEDRRIDIDL